MYKKIWKFSKSRITWIFIIAIADGINMFLTTYFFKFAIDIIMQKQPFYYMIILVAIRLGYLLFYQCLDNILHTIIFPKLENLIRRGITLELYNKIPYIDMVNYDYAETYDKITRAIDEADNRALWMLGTLRGLLSSTIQMLVLFISLAILSPFSIIVAILGTLVTFWANIINSKKVYNFEMDKVSINRKLDYVKRIFYMPQYKVDIHITNLGKVMEKKYYNDITDLNNTIKKHAPSIAAIAISASWLFNFLNIGISSIYISKRIYDGVMTVGDFSSVITAITNLSNNFLNYSNILPELRSHALFIENYLEVLSMKTEIYNEENKLILSKGDIKNIRLVNIYFRYSNSDFVLKNINFEINKGQKIALVGENGAGKSSLLKIIIGLYQPTEGQIEINNISFNDINTKSYYNNLAVVSQDFQIYALSILDNIILSEDNIFDSNKVWEVIQLSGLEDKTNNLTKKLETQLSTEFSDEGINFSGGENQKLAIARALYQDAQILIMDEPSSSLDPKSEKELFDVIDNISKDKTVIVVSHRMSCVKNMNMIYYFENGSIIEHGTHTELINMNGKYAQAFRLQAERYGNT